MSNSFYSTAELSTLGFKSLGDRVYISKKTSIYRPEAISIGNNVRIDDFSVLAGGCGINIGNYVHIACYCALYGASGIELHDFSGLSARVTIYSESDDYTGNSLTNPMVPDEFKPRYSRGRVIIGKHVIVGTNTTIMPGLCLDEGVAVGANSLVTKNCDAWSIYFGNPAKRLKSRSKKLIDLEMLLNSRNL